MSGYGFEEITPAKAKAIKYHDKLVALLVEIEDSAYNINQGNNVEMNLKHLEDEASQARALLSELGVPYGPDREMPSKNPDDIPVIFELDEDNEATGTTYRFCSQQCADKFNMRDLNSHMRLLRWTWGEEPRSSSPDGELCLTCELPVDDTKEYLCGNCGHSKEDHDGYAATGKCWHGCGSGNRCTCGEFSYT